ncbi:hypothetical protein [Sorangium cellulosum]|nr:hypothetical protein [Sorangium cellulosum]
MTFDTGAGWDGTCTPAGAPSQDDALASVTFEAPALAACAPSPAPKPSPVVATFGKACAGYIDAPARLDSAFFHVASCESSG